MNFNILQGGSSTNVDSLLQASSAFNKMSLLKGYEGIWIQARRDNHWYILNKLLSITIAAFCAYLTLSFKKTTQIYYLEA